ncbi:zinc finger protein OZF-like [Neocloeon triangulifer]|uniref:zinc finger protein OZF-like n=1 Tax=Neocloeon triangulifer TaxID=2078957 RepID=UPI00286FA5B2|nr:zinc finger protein OZF-like [Neocloeon triangulifer]
MDPIVVKFEQLCRICCFASSDTAKQSFNIFHGASSASIREKITACLPIDLKEDDGLPKTVCDTCCKTLDVFFQFRTTSLENEFILKDLASKIKSEENSVPKNSEDVPLEIAEEVEWAGEEDRPSLDSESEEQEEEGKVEGEPSVVQVHQEVTQQKMKELGLDLCKFCNLVFFEHELKGHIKSKHKKEPPNKNKELITTADFKIKSETLSCDFCTVTFRLKDRMLEHILTHLGQKAYSCEFCDKQFSKRACLRNHSKRHTNMWTHICKFCDKGFAESTSLKYHVRSQHTKEKIFKCDKCSKSFYKNQDLKIHKRRNHNDQPEIFSQACPTCKKVFQDDYALRLHLKTHIPVDERRKYKCSECPAAFTGTSGLKRHKLVHTGEMPFECKICGWKMRTKRGHEVHMINHSGVKSYMCEVCGKAFALDSTLKVHKRTHTGEKPYRPYPCKDCGKRFSQVGSYKFHLPRCGQEKKKGETVDGNVPNEKM